MIEYFFASLKKNTSASWPSFIIDYQAYKKAGQLAEFFLKPENDTFKMQFHILKVLLSAKFD